MPHLVSSALREHAQVRQKGGLKGFSSGWDTALLLFFPHIEKAGEQPQRWENAQTGSRSQAVGEGTVPALQSLRGPAVRNRQPWEKVDAGCWCGGIPVRYKLYFGAVSPIGREKLFSKDYEPLGPFARQSSFHQPPSLTPLSFPQDGIISVYSYLLRT